MNPTIIQAVAAKRNQDLLDHAAAIRLIRQARRSRRSQRGFRAHGQSWLRSAPAHAGDSNQIARQVSHGSVNNPAMEQRTSAMLARVSPPPEVMDGPYQGLAGAFR